MVSTLLFAGILGANAAAPSLSPAWYSTTADYTLSWWADGWRGRDAQGRRLLDFQTGSYGMSFDPLALRLVGLGRLSGDRTYEAAAKGDGRAIEALPKASLAITAAMGGCVYRAVRAGGSIKTIKSYLDYANYPIRLIEGGRFLQRYDILELEFEDDQGRKLPAVGRLEIVAWPGRLSFVAHLDRTDARLSVRIEAGETKVTGEGRPFAGTPDFVPGGQIASVDYYPSADGAKEESEDVQVVATNLNAPGGRLKSSFDATHGWHKVQMDPTEWSEADDINRLDRIQVSLDNPTDLPKTVRLLFERDKTVGGLTGMVPMIRTVDGTPTAVPMQVSKNWPKAHDSNDVEYGPWARHLTVLHLPAHTKSSFEFDVTYGMWGGVPGASHDQLCLVGWGYNGAWDVAALGCWGESICYEPEMSQDRGFVDDFRPLMVWSNSGARRKWFWTNNVGGGDVLVYLDPSGKRQHFSRVRTAYLSHGPNLSDVLYAGETQDGNVRARVEVLTPRSDDINRSLHHLRYDVVRRTPFSRLAFYQLGADRYNDTQFERLAMGTETGLKEEWGFTKGGLKYDRQRVLGSGRVNWVSLHQADFDRKNGPSANRGLIVRSWKARLGGKEVPNPSFSFYGTEDQRPGMNVELSPPPGVKELLPGDYVEATVEVLAMPTAADDYYGPNEGLQRALTLGANTWRPIFREAAQGAVVAKAEVGTLRQSLPVEVSCANDRAKATLIGGLAYIPVRFSGLRRCDGLRLFVTQGGKRSLVDQSLHGKDFWQTERDPVSGLYTVTYNVPANEAGDRKTVVELTGAP